MASQSVAITSDASAWWTALCTKMQQAGRKPTSITGHQVDINRLRIVARTQTPPNTHTPLRPTAVIYNPLTNASVSLVESTAATAGWVTITY